MARLAVVLVSVLIQAAWGSAVGSHNVGVIGGTNISIKDAPYMALLGQAKGRGGPCGGIIVHEKFILTTATCCDYGSGIAHWGSNGTDRTGYYKKVKKYIKYVPAGLKTNICLVEVEKPWLSLPYGDIANKIQLTDGSPILAEGTLVNFTAFGWAGRDIPEHPDARTLRQVTLPINGSDWCKRDTERLDHSILCAGNHERNACYGDAGGALTYKGVLIGVLSDAPSDCISRAARFSSINYYRGWIKKTIGQSV